MVVGRWLRRGLKPPALPAYVRGPEGPLFHLRSRRREGGVFDLAILSRWPPGFVLAGQARRLSLRGGWEEVAGGEKAFAEVAGDDFLFVADRSQVDAGVPALEYIDVRRYLLQVFSP